MSLNEPAAPQSTIAEILRERAQQTPNQVAFCFLIDGDQEGPRLTYGQLDRQARMVAAALQDIAGPGERALLVYPPGLDFIPAFFGCLYAGVIAVPAYPPRLDRLVQGLDALRALMADCQPRAVLTTTAVAPFLTGIGNSAAGYETIRWINTDALDPALARLWREPAIRGDWLALLQYTSGSTAAPKGVMIAHQNLMHNLVILDTAWESTADAGVCWLPLYHDMGLISGILSPVFHGTPCWHMSPLGILQKPFRWLQAIARYRADISGGPNFIYDYCVERITPEQKATLDLRHWTVAGVGAEPIQPRTLERFADAFAPCGFRPEAFYPCYGLAEATLMVTGVGRAARPAVVTVDATMLEQGRVIDAAPGAGVTRSLVGCGHTWLDQRLLIVDPEKLVRCLEDRIGEIWVAGPSVARGYWNRPEETERAFGAHLADTGEGPFLRTGDLGFVKHGQLFITGRIKELIVIRGRNHYPKDIEETVQTVHPGLRPGCGAALEVSRDGVPSLVVVQEVERRCRSLDVGRLIGDIRQVVAERHELQVHDVQLLEHGSIPKTSSGKIKRHACRIGYERGTLRRWKGKNQ